MLPAERVELRQLPSEPEPVDVDLWTRYEDVGLAAPLPRETFFEVTLGADSVDAAIAGAGTVATGLATMISFCVNAFVHRLIRCWRTSVRQVWSGDSSGSGICSRESTNFDRNVVSMSAHSSHSCTQRSPHPMRRGSGAQ